MKNINTYDSSKICRKLALIFILFCSVYSRADSNDIDKTLLISDIDDTIKASHVRSLIGKIRYFHREENLISGMNGLYDQLVNHQHHNNIEIVYLTNAPKWLMEGHHKDFIQYNNFPKGEIYFRETESKNTHKLKTIRKLIEKKSPKRLILIGDNGEMDSYVYDKIYQEYGHRITILQFIRTTYPVAFDDNLMPHQVNFVTPVEICIALAIYNLDVCSEEFILKIIKDVFLETSSEEYGGYFFHPYMNCYGNKWPFKDKTNNILNFNIEPFITHLETICN